MLPVASTEWDRMQDSQQSRAAWASRGSSPSLRLVYVMENESFREGIDMYGIPRKCWKNQLPKKTDMS
jgi:hypothetical protein